MPRRSFLGVAAFIVAAPLSLHADIVLDFDTFADGELITSQVSNLVFHNAVALTAGATLNEFEFPPRSGANVLSDSGGPISIDFATPVVSFGGYFTYIQSLVLTAYDTGDMVIGSVTSSFPSNLALSGDPNSSPNEFLSLVSAPGISRVVILADVSGGSFTLDDAAIGNSINTPEPSSLILISLTFGFWLLARALAIFIPGATDQVPVEINLCGYPEGMQRLRS